MRKMPSTWGLLESDKGLRVFLLNYNPSLAASMPVLLQLWQCMAWPSPQLRWKINHHREPEIHQKFAPSEKSFAPTKRIVSPCLFAPLIATTFQGIGGAGGRLHAVQQRLAEGHGSQCGFCTPGIGGLIILKFVFFSKLNLSIGNVAVMSMYTLLRNKPIPNMEDIDTYFQVRLHRKLFPSVT